ncbi:MAG: Gfo/Idh/MocA family oxidoreductase, partial [Candidatus Hydrogenedentes bacterium]|nr:Gfo/Idh/MocA family oxidoreductase [Candidatus Hydrogenedentota bacterium]
GVIITASAKTDEIVHQAAQMCRKRGRIILVGVVGLNLHREDFYAKELTFQVSCSYGPGRYDEKYEQANQDYPMGYVRWTEQRNFEAVLSTIAAGRLNVERIITHRFPFERALEAYKQIHSNASAIGVLLTYPGEPATDQVVTMKQPAVGTADNVRVGVIGAGSFAKGVLLPALSRTTAELAHIADLNPTAAAHAARKFGIEQVSTDYRAVLDDKKILAVFILVGHHLHARFVCEALQAGKHVFVEKPLAMSKAELTQVAEAVEANPERMLMVGFNRRFSPHTFRVKEALAGRIEPLTMSMMVNAGAIPADHWTQDPERGGGRIIGEGCHFINLLSHLAGSPVATVSAMMVGEGPSVREDKMAILLHFADGSIGAVNYFANGSKSYPKETVEIYSEGRVLRIENFRVTRGYGVPQLRKFKTVRQDKGHRAEVMAFIERIKNGGPPLIPFDELHNSTEASFAAVEAARTMTMLHIHGR